MRKKLETIFQKLDQAQVSYCLIRDADQLERISPIMEIDILIAPKHLREFEALATELGFIHLVNWGYHPHNFYLDYDEVNNYWLKLDVITEVSFGISVPSIRTSFSENCLKNRQKKEGFFIPSPIDELIILVLHCLFDKGVFTPARQQRIQVLWKLVKKNPGLKKELATYFSKPEEWGEIERQLQTGSWEQLLANRQKISTSIAHNNRFLTTVSGLWLLLLRKINRIRKLINPVAPSIALLAPDGAGKSTLASRLKEISYFQVETIYMGLYQKQNKLSGEKSVPGFKSIARLLKIWQNYAKARYYQAGDHMVVFDRYIYDALLPPQRPLSTGEKISRWVISHSCPDPDLTILLDAPGDVLFARKEEHSPSFLEHQRQAYNALKLRIPNVVTIDATQSVEVNQHNVMALVWRLIQGKRAGQNFNFIVREWIDASKDNRNAYQLSVESGIEIPQ